MRTTILTLILLLSISSTLTSQIIFEVKPNINKVCIEYDPCGFCNTAPQAYCDWKDCTRACEQEIDLEGLWEDYNQDCQGEQTPGWEEYCLEQLKQQYGWYDYQDCLEECGLQPDGVLSILTADLTFKAYWAQSPANPNPNQNVYQTDYDPHVGNQYQSGAGYAYDLVGQFGHCFSLPSAWEDILENTNGDYNWCFEVSGTIHFFDPMNAPNTWSCTFTQTFCNI